MRYLMINVVEIRDKLILKNPNNTVVLAFFAMQHSRAQMKVICIKKLIIKIINKNH